MQQPARTIAVVGLGYVGLPVAVALSAEKHRVIGYDIDERRISELQRGHDRTREVPERELLASDMLLTSKQADLGTADFFIVTVPTPIDAARKPDLSAVLHATETVGKVLKPGDIVVYESTVFPGATEELCIPMLERTSGLNATKDFSVGYSPERINPGDSVHRFSTITKVVSANSLAALEIIAEVYGSAVKAGIYRAPSIRVAEAAKVIENAQRDLNIAFMNELSLIFEALGLDTLDVLAAARTKWNFLDFRPGLVGGHCIGVDPYYLTHRAEMAGYHPEIILAGRRINDGIGKRVARECVRRLLKGDRRGHCVTVLGLTFKENVPDIRNSKVVDIVEELQSFGLEVQVCDPYADSAEARVEYGIDLLPLDTVKPADAVVVAVSHSPYVSGGWTLVSSLLKDGKGAVIDIKGLLERNALPPNVDLWRL